MMETMRKPDQPTPVDEVAVQVGRRPVVSLETLERMSLEALLYYVLVGDGRRLLSYNK